MSYYEGEGRGVNREQDAAGRNYFTGFARPYFDFIGTGQIYALVYIVMAIFNLLLPLGAIFVVMESGFLRNSGFKVTAAFISLLVIICFACWIGFQLWWYRRLNVKKVASSEFVATPFISDLVQTFGEWLGTFIGILGAGIGLIAVIFLRDSMNGFLLSGLAKYMHFAPLIIIAGPLVGFFQIIFFRFIAEQIRIFAAIANNTKDMVRKIRRAN